MPYVEFEFVEVINNHVILTDDSGKSHAIPEHMLEDETKEFLEVGTSVLVFLSSEYCNRMRITK